MSSASFYPYRTGPERIRLVIGTVDGDVECTGDGSIAAYGEDLQILKLRATAAVPFGLLEFVLPPAELSAPPVEVLLVYRSIESRKRAMLRMPGDGIHEVELALDRRDWVATLNVQAVLVRSRTSSEVVPGFASDHGSLLAWSAPRRVLFDEPPLPPGDRIQIEWEPFEKSRDPWRKRHPGNLFALDLSGIRPVVYLNSSVPGARSILNSAGTHGRKARIRDATNFMILHQVWSSLLAVALSDLAATAGDQLTVEERLAEIGDWQRRVLRDWSPHLYPERDSESALEGVVSAAGDPQRTAELLARLPNAIQDRFNTVRGFSGLAGDFETL